MTMRARVDEERASVSLCQAGFHNVHNEKLKAKATVGKYRPGATRVRSRSLDVPTHTVHR